MLILGLYGLMHATLMFNVKVVKWFITKGSAPCMTYPSTFIFEHTDEEHVTVSTHISDLLSCGKHRMTWICGICTLIICWLAWNMAVTCGLTGITDRVRQAQCPILMNDTHVFNEAIRPILANTHTDKELTTTAESRMTTPDATVHIDEAATDQEQITMSHYTAAEDDGGTGSRPDDDIQSSSQEVDPAYYERLEHIRAPRQDSHTKAAVSLSPEAAVFQLGATASPHPQLQEPYRDKPRQTRHDQPSTILSHTWPGPIIDVLITGPVNLCSDLMAASIWTKPTSASLQHSWTSPSTSTPPTISIIEPQEEDNWAEDDKTIDDICFIHGLSQIIGHDCIDLVQLTDTSS
jgi:hypothetical protein